MSTTTTWYISFLWFLYIQGSIYALPTTPEPASQSLSASHARRDRYTHKYTFNGIEYSAERLPEDEKGSFSVAYKITDGFQVGDKRVPAIIKQVVDKGAENENSKTRQEIEFLKRESVGLYLYHQWSTQTWGGHYQIEIVVRDVGGLDPPFKPFYKWYLEDKTMNAIDSLRNARENIEKRLQWFREEENLLYGDVKMDNIFLRKAALQSLGMKREINGSIQVMPIDWGPPDGSAGVRDIASLANDSAAKSKSLLNHATHVRKYLERNFCVEALYVDLKRRGLRLREKDIVTKKFKDKIYNLLPIIEASPQDNIETYAIIGEFQKTKALMRVIEKVDKIKGKDVIKEMKKRWKVLDSKWESDEACLQVIYIDERR